MSLSQPFDFQLELHNIITEVRAAPVCRASVRSERGLFLSDPNCIV